MPETYQNKYHMVFEPGSNPTVINDAVFTGTVYAQNVVDPSAERGEKKEVEPLERLKVIISALAKSGKDGRSLILPYATFFVNGKAPKMSHTEFNETFGTSLSQSTFSRWTYAVFNNVDHDYMYSQKELEYYVGNL